MGVGNDGELTEILARASRANGEGDVQVVKAGQKRGPKKKHGPRQEVHLKFNPETMRYIEKQSNSYQSYFEELVYQDVERHGGRVYCCSQCDHVLVVLPGQIISAVVPSHCDVVMKRYGDKGETNV